MAGEYENVACETSSGAGKGAIDLGLERMHELLDAQPPLTVPAVHLAGTNGKGSVSALLDSALRASGLSTGRYNSPHLVEPRDAIRINGQPLSQDEHDLCTRRVMDINARLNVGASTFEIATAAAFLAIQRADVDIMIIECGMGGARDATNVLSPERVLACGLTAVGLDHTGFLGSTVEAIAAEKAKIVGQDGVICVGAQQYPGVIQVARQTAYERGAAFIIAQTVRHAESSRAAVSLRPFRRPHSAIVEAEYQGIPMTLSLGLPGAHQTDNLALAVTILDTISRSDRALAIQPKLRALTAESLKTGLEQVEWEGRCSWLQLESGMPILVDGAHNADSAKTLRAYIDSLDIDTGHSSPSTPHEKPGPAHWIVSLSFSAEKSVESVLEPLLRPGDSVSCLRFSTPVEGMPWVKPVPPAEVARVARRLVAQNGNGKSEVEEQADVRLIDKEAVDGLQAALDPLQDEWEAGRPRLTVVCGSLYLVADAYRLIR